MKLTRKQKNQIEKSKSLTPEEISRKFGLELIAVTNYLESLGRELPHSTGTDPKGRGLPTSLKKVVLNFVGSNRYKIVFIALMTLIVYSSSLMGGAVSDDKPLLAAMQSGNYTSEALREPVNAAVTVATYLFNYALSGVGTWSYHLVNVLLHILVSLLIFFFLLLVTNSRVSFLAALIFAVNPLHSESVDWVSGRHYILYSIFVLGGLVTYFYFTQIKTQVRYYLLTLGLFIAAIYAFPEQAIIFPLLLPLLDFLKGGIKKNWKYYLVFFFLSAMFAYLSINRIQARVVDISGGTAVSKGNIFEFLIGDVTAVFSYLKLFLLPVGLSFYHEAITTPNLYLTLYGAVSLLFLVGIPLFFRRNRLVIFAVLFFLVTLLPTLTPLKVSWVVAERYTYLATLGPALLTALAADHLLKNIKLRQMSTISLVILVSFWSLSTFVRGFDWKDEDSLWVATTKASPDSSKTWNNMGDYYGRHGDLQASFDAFVRATQINPTYADAWHNAGNTLLQMGKTEESIPYFEKSLQFNPGLIEAYNKLAIIYQKKGSTQKAYETVNKALQINPGESEIEFKRVAKAYLTLAQIEYDNKNLEKARQALIKAQSFDPQNEIIRKNLSILENSPQQMQQNP